MHKAEVAGSGKGRGRQTRILFFVLFKFCFILSRKTRKARKSSEFGIPSTISLDEHKVLTSCSLLISQQMRTEQDNANVRSWHQTTALQTEKKPCKQTLDQIYVIYFYSILMHPGFFNFENQGEVLKVTKAPPTLIISIAKTNWPSFLQKNFFSDHQQPDKFGGRAG